MVSNIYSKKYFFGALVAFSVIFGMHQYAVSKGSDTFSQSVEMSQSHYQNDSILTGIGTGVDRRMTPTEDAVTPPATDNNDSCITPDEAMGLVITPETSSKVELVKTWSSPVDIAGIKKGVSALDGRSPEEYSFDYIQVYKNSDIKGSVYLVLFMKVPEAKTDCMIAYFWFDEASYDKILEIGLPKSTNAGLGEIDMTIPIINLGNIVSDPHLVNGIAKNPGSKNS
jgi:hypothetical protein